MNEKNDKMIDRVRKLLAMAKDSSSPEESAIAAKRARSLMDQYQITEMDLTSLEDDDFGNSNFGLNKKSADRALGIVAVAVAKLNDTVVKYDRDNDGKLEIRFDGFLVDAVCAREMLVYLRTEMYRQSERFSEGKSNRHSYRMGFAAGIVEQVDEIMKEREQLKMANGTALMVVKNQIVAEKFGVGVYKKRKTSYRSSDDYNSGYERGKRTSLNRQVNSNNAARLT